MRARLPAEPGRPCAPSVSELLIHAGPAGTAARHPPDPRTYSWAVEYGGYCIGSAGLRIDPGQHCANYTVGLFVGALRGRGLGREVTRLVLAWAFDVLGVRREAELYPDGWKDFIMMGLLRSEHSP